MNKKVILYDYRDTPKEVEIENIEDVVLIKCKVLAGDELLEVYYKDNFIPVRFDSSENRIEDFDDGEVEIPVDKLDEFSKITNSYDMLHHFGDTNVYNRVGQDCLDWIVDMFLL